MTTSMASQQRLTLEPAHRRWLVVNALLIPVAVNAVLNAGIAWLSSRGDKTVPLMSVSLHQKPSTMTDTIETLFMLPFVTALLVTLSVRRDQRAGRLPPLQLSRRFDQAVALLPEQLLRRAAVCGAICLGSLGPIAGAVLNLVGLGNIAETSFVLYKMVLCVCLGLLVTPLIALTAMASTAD